ncbi:MAG: hypothetical protein SGI74_04655 [Oligoflexia bacterium]|nr:hypothetical protein [Oligoflexia bacterium]
MQSIAKDIPKALLPAGSQTFIDWQLQWLRLLGVSEVIMALGHRGDLIEKYLQTKTSLIYPKIKFSYDGSSPLGTGGAVKRAITHLQEDFLVAYGDSFLFINLVKLMRTHVKAKNPVTFSIMKNQNIGDTSNVTYRNGQMFYDKFNITPDMEFIDYGMSVFSKNYFIKNSPEGTFDLAQFVTQACKDQRITPFVVNEPFYETGSVEGYEIFKNFIESNTNLRKLATEKGII